MTRTTPNYIEHAQVQDTRLSFKWDDWNVEKAYEPTDEVLQERLDRLSHRAVLSFTIAACEWIAHRFAPLLDNPMPFHYLEAAWAAVVNWRYCKYYEPPDEEWFGPVRGPASLAVIFVVDAIVRVEEEDIPAIQAVCASGLAEHVLPSTESFRKWQDFVLERLERFHPFSDQDPLGDVVPNEALNPNCDFKPEIIGELIQAYLSKLNPCENQFLRTTEEMLELGFRGTPYRFDLEADRITRNDY
jgi:hypothetical protein